MKSNRNISNCWGLFPNKREKKQNTASIAKIRLETVLSKDHANRRVDFLPQMESEIVAVLTKYMNISPNDICCNIDDNDGEQTLELNVNLPKDEEIRKRAL
jgi:cell division topological specificity factor